MRTRKLLFPQRKEEGWTEREDRPSVQRHFHRCSGEDGCTAAAAAAAAVQRGSSASLLWGPEERLQWTLPVPEERGGPGSGEAPLSRRSPATFCFSQKPVDVRHPGTVHHTLIFLCKNHRCSQAVVFLAARVRRGIHVPSLLPQSHHLSQRNGGRLGVPPQEWQGECCLLQASLNGIPAGTCALLFVCIHAAVGRLRRLLQNPERGDRAAAQTLRPLHP